MTLTILRALSPVLLATKLYLMKLYLCQIIAVFLSKRYRETVCHILNYTVLFKTQIIWGENLFCSHGINAVFFWYVEGLKGGRARSFLRQQDGSTD